VKCFSAFNWPRQISLAREYRSAPVKSDFVRRRRWIRRRVRRTVNPRVRISLLEVRGLPLPPGFRSSVGTLCRPVCKLRLGDHECNGPELTLADDGEWCASGGATFEIRASHFRDNEMLRVELYHLSEDPTPVLYALCSVRVPLTALFEHGDCGEISTSPRPDRAAVDEGSWFAADSTMDGGASSRLVELGAPESGAVRLSLSALL
jgi:hypothetical protein